MAQRTQLKQIIELGVSQRQMNDHFLHDAVVALAQSAARARVAASAPAAMTDNSSGTADGAFGLEAVVTPVEGIVDGVISFSPKAGFDTAITAIAAANKELIAKANALLVLITGTSGVRITATTGGTNDGTIAAITHALTAATSACVAAAKGKLEINKARNMQATIQSALNYCRVAMGLAPASDNSGGIFDRTIAGWDIDSQESASTGTAAAATEATLTDASADAALLALTNNIASMAASVNQMRGTVAIGPFVIATSNARARNKLADITV